MAFVQNNLNCLLLKMYKNRQGGIFCHFKNLTVPSTDTTWIIKGFHILS